MAPFLFLRGRPGEFARGAVTPEAGALAAGFAVELVVAGRAAWLLFDPRPSADCLSATVRVFTCWSAAAVFSAGRVGGGVVAAAAFCVVLRATAVGAEAFSVTAAGGDCTARGAAAARCFAALAAAFAPLAHSAAAAAAFWRAVVCGDVGTVFHTCCFFFESAPPARRLTSAAACTRTYAAFHTSLTYANRCCLREHGSGSRTARREPGDGRFARSMLCRCMSDNANVCSSSASTLSRFDRPNGTATVRSGSVVSAASW